MKINRSTARNSINVLINYIKNNDFESCLEKMSYLTGIYAAFYTAAVLDNLDYIQKTKFLEALSKKCDFVAEETDKNLESSSI